MFREMIKSKKQLTEAETNDVLNKCEYMTLSTIGSDGWPYATPLSYVVIDGKVYFHCFTKGQKLDNIAYNPNVCLNAVRDVEAIWEDDFTTYYQSATIFGTAKVLEDGELKRKALIELVDKYLPDYMDKADGIIEQTKNSTAVVEITPLHTTGKAKKRK